MDDVTGKGVVVGCPDHLQRVARNLCDRLGLVYETASRRHWVWRIRREHGPSLEPFKDLALDVAHEILGTEARATQLPTHALEAKGEAACICRVGLMGWGGYSGDLGGAGEVGGQRLRECRAGRGMLQSKVLAACGDDVGVTREAGWCGCYEKWTWVGGRYGPFSLRRAQRLPSLSVRFFFEATAAGLRCSAESSVSRWANLPARAWLRRIAGKDKGTGPSSTAEAIVVAEML